MKVEGMQKKFYSNSNLATIVKKKFISTNLKANR